MAEHARCMTTTQTVHRLDLRPRRPGRPALDQPAAPALRGTHRRGVPLGAHPRSVERPPSRPGHDRDPGWQRRADHRLRPSRAGPRADDDHRVAARAHHRRRARRPRAQPLRRTGGRLPHLRLRRHGRRGARPGRRGLRGLDRRGAAAGTRRPSRSPAARARVRGPSTRASSSCSTSTASSSTTGPRSPCSVTSTPTATTERQARAMAAHVPPVADERESLIAYLDQQRDAFVTVAHGLTEEQIRLAPTAGTLSIGGLIKHVTTCERGWTERMAAAPERAGAARPVRRAAGHRLGRRLPRHRRRHARVARGRARRAGRRDA